jgi:prophage regulatory protein
MRVLRKPEVQAKVGLKQATIDQKEAAGEFPKRIRLGRGRAVGWIESEIDGWIGGWAAERDRSA